MARHGPGGKIAPDGRAPVAPGVGKNARRHDLEQPATPGLAGSDLQQGDVQRLEQAQQIAPRPKRNQPPAKGGSTAQKRQPTSTEPSPIPDPIEMAGSKIGGSAPVAESSQEEPLDIEKWKPLLMEIARNPNVSGPLTTTLLAYLSNTLRIPNASGVRVIDQNAADVALREAL